MGEIPGGSACPSVQGARPNDMQPSLAHGNSSVSQEGLVYAVEFSHRSGRDLINMVCWKGRSFNLLLKVIVLAHTDDAISDRIFLVFLSYRLRSAPTSSPLLRMPVTLTSTACLCPWSTASLLTLHSPTRYFGVLQLSCLHLLTALVPGWIPSLHPSLFRLFSPLHAFPCFPSSFYLLIFNFSLFLFFQTRIVGVNAHQFLKNDGHFVISIKASCIDSTAPAAAVFAAEVKKMKKEKMKPIEQLTLEPYERDHAVVVGTYRYVVSKKNSSKKS